MIQRPATLAVSLFLLAVIASTSPSSLVWAAEFYVAPNGSPSGAGTISNPWTLATALSHPSLVRPGDTIWLRGGVYTGAFTSRLTGAAGQPIVVRQYPGERATLDGNGNAWDTPVLKVEGAWTWYRDFEITHSGPRILNSARSQAVDVYGPNTKVINLIIHDAGQGIGLWTPAIDAEAYGNLIYNNGWDATDRGHGHGIYTQNDTGQKRISDNISFAPFSFAFHAYGTSAARLNNFYLTRNVFFNGPVLVGGQPPARGVTLDDNTLYRSNTFMGYDNQDNSNLSIVNNYFANFVYLKWWSNAAMTNNLLFPLGQTSQDAAVSITTRPGGSPADFTLNNNTYHQGPGRDGWDFYLTSPAGSGSHMFSMWQGAFGYDLQSTYTKTRPAAAKVFVRQNQYDPNRAHIVIYNWPLQQAVPVDLSSLNLQSGEVVEIRNAQNYFAQSMTATYTGGPVSIPMTGWTAAIPLGHTQPMYPATFPEFGAFILIRKSAAPSISVQVTPGAATLQQGATQQFAATVSGTTNSAVTWSVIPAIGNVSQTGLYSAPASVASQTTVTVTARAAADATKSASATVTLVPQAAPVVVSVTPASATLNGGQSQQFSASVTGTTNSAVTWSISPAVGSVSPAGLYSAPASVASQTTVTVKATSSADPTKSASASVTLAPAPVVAVAVSPASVTLSAGQTRQFAATVTGSTNTAVTWSVNPAVGSVSAAGLYTAPASVSAQATVTVTARSVADAAKSASATVTLAPTPVVSVSITPASASLAPAQTRQFAATVTGSTNTAVTWSISPAIGTVTVTGLYSAPISVGAQTAVTVTAKSVADPTKTASALLTIVPPAAIAVAVSPASSTLGAGQTRQFSATVTGTTNTAVTWYCSPAVGTLSASGLYTAPASLAAQTVVTVRATSVADSTKSATATLTLTPAPAIAVAVNPAAVTLRANQAQQFAAAINGAASSAVTWSISPQIGTISTAGLYRAPASVSAQTIVTVTAKSVADPTKSAIAQVTLTNSAPIQMLISPTWVNLKAGRTYRFYVQVYNVANTAVTWSISPQLGSISSDGTYTAPATVTGNPLVTVKATSVADPSASISATVKLLP